MINDFSVWDSESYEFIPLFSFQSWCFRMWLLLYSNLCLYCHWCIIYAFKPAPFVTKRTNWSGYELSWNWTCCIMNLLKWIMNRFYSSLLVKCGVNKWYQWYIYLWKTNSYCTSTFLHTICLRAKSDSPNLCSLKLSFNSQSLKTLASNNISLTYHAQPLP